MSYSLTIPAQKSSAHYGTYKKQIGSTKTAIGYGLPSTKGYLITSKAQLGCQTIQKVLGTFIKLEIGALHFRRKEQAFADRPGSEWLDSKEYLTAKQNFEAAQADLEHLKLEHGIISISVTVMGILLMPYRQ